MFETEEAKAGERDIKIAEHDADAASADAARKEVYTDAQGNRVTLDHGVATRVTEAEGIHGTTAGEAKSAGELTPTHYSLDDKSHYAPKISHGTVSVGRIVHYTLSEDDAAKIKADRAALLVKGEVAVAGQIVPLMVVRVSATGDGVVSGHAFLDGDDHLWVVNAKEGTEPGTWQWPARA